MATRNYEGKKIKGDSALTIVDSLTIEEALQININNKPFTVSMRTPGNDIEFVRGLLHAEGVINNIDFTPEISLKKENDKGIIESISDENLAIQLLAMGFILGEEVKVERIAPLNDPIIITSGNSYISIRKKDAQQITITKT